MTVYSPQIAIFHVEANQPTNEATITPHDYFDKFSPLGSRQSNYRSSFSACTSIKIGNISTFESSRRSRASLGRFFFIHNPRLPHGSLQWPICRLTLETTPFKYLPSERECIARYVASALGNRLLSHGFLSFLLSAPQPAFLPNRVHMPRLKILLLVFAAVVEVTRSIFERFYSQPHVRKQLQFLAGSKLFFIVNRGSFVLTKKRKSG